MERQLNFFIARSRESLSSLMFLILVISGFDIFNSLIISIIFGSLTLLIYLVFKQKKYITNLLYDFKRKLTISKKLFVNLLLANLSVLIINLWALYYSKLDILIFEFSSVNLARISLYIFQIITLGSIYFTLKIDYIKSSVNYIKNLFFFFFLLSLITIQSIFHFIFVPITVGLLHYYFIHRLNDYKK